MKKTFLLTAAIFLSCFAWAQMPIPIDNNVRIGRLENGLTYYVRHNEEPKGQANFYIAQKVGSILEEEEQRGLAHFLEHMCFNGTKHFPGNGVIKYCESIGVKFGADLNAYTSIDETVYNIDNVPVATVPSAVDSCLWILRDWADGLLLLDEDIDDERGVIHEEWRSRNNAQMRMLDKILPEIYPNNRYGTRMPIGVMEVVDFFPYQALRDYYHKWYRPDQQGIVVVGDIDVDQVENKIREIFGTIAKPENPAERYYIQVEDNKEPIVSIAKDKEQPYALTYIFCKHDAYPDNEKGDLTYYIYQYAANVMQIMLSQRLEELAQSATPPFIQASIYDGDFFLSKTKKALCGIAVTNENDLTKGISTVYREMLRAVRNGFTESEYERARAEILTHIESAYNERNKVKSANYCKEYVRHFIDNEPIPGIENEFALSQQLIPNIPLQVINQYINTLISDSNLVVACMLPEKEGVTYPTEAELKTLFANVAAENIAPYQDKVSNEPLIAKAPKAGKVKKTEESLFGYKKITLSNGVVVYYKTTDFKADQIRMNAFSRGGTSLYPESDAINLKVATEVFTLGGVSNFSQTDLSKLLAGKKVSLSPAINTYSETIDGVTTPKDFETMLQLNYLYFTDLRTDPEVFKSWQTKQIAILTNAASNPMTAFSDTLLKEFYPEIPRLKSFTTDEVEKVDYNRIMQIAKERFANAADFTFIFTGNIDETTFIPMIELYLASLPAKGKAEIFKDFGASPRKGVRENIFSREMETPIATIFMNKFGDVTYNLKNELTYSIAGQVLDIMMTEEIREKEGGTYGVSISADINTLPKTSGSMEVFYQTDPDKYEYLNQRIEEIIAGFAKSGPSAENMAKVKDYMIKKHQENLRENSYFAAALKTILLHNQDMLTDYEKILESITAEDIRLAIDNLLKQNNNVKVIMKGIQK